MVKSGCHAGCGRGFQCRGLKQAPSCEFFPAEAVRTNILGTENVFDMQPIMEVSGTLPYSLKAGVERTVEWLREMGET